jgi:hypothetical protein
MTGLWPDAAVACSGKHGQPVPGQAVFMTEGKPELKPVERVTAAMDEFMATVLRHLRTGQSSPLEELGLDKAKDELQHWRPDIPGAETEQNERDRAAEY